MFWLVRKKYCIRKNYHSFNTITCRAIDILITLASLSVQAEQKVQITKNILFLLSAAFSHYCCKDIYSSFIFLFTIFAAFTFV